MNFGDKINFFICLVLILLFQKAQVNEKIYRDEVSVLRLENYQICSMFKVSIANNSQMTLIPKHFIINPLSTKLRKSSNTLKQFVGNLPTNCLSVFGHFVGLALKGLIHSKLSNIRTNLQTDKFKHFRVNLKKL